MAAEKLQHLQDGRGSTKRVSLKKTQDAFTNGNLVRNSFTIKTWIAIGAALQLSLFALPIKHYYVALPVVIYLAIEIIGALLVIVGLRSDPMHAGVLDTKYTSLVPDEQGNFKSGSQGQGLSIFFLGFRCNHHLGLLAPGFKEIGDNTSDMLAELEEKADEYGFLGSSTYNNISAMSKGTEITFVMHFKSNADVLRYAQSPLHRKAWDSYNKHVKQYPHLGIMHELYEVPAGNWESIYKNTVPSLLATTQHKVVDEDGNTKWVSPLIEASKGKIASTAYRLA